MPQFTAVKYYCIVNSPAYPVKTYAASCQKYNYKGRVKDSCRIRADVQSFGQYPVDLLYGVCHIFFYSGYQYPCKKNKSVLSGRLVCVNVFVLKISWPSA